MGGSSTRRARPAGDVVRTLSNCVTYPHADPAFLCDLGFTFVQSAWQADWQEAQDGGGGADVLTYPTPRKDAERAALRSDLLDLLREHETNLNNAWGA